MVGIVGATVTESVDQTVRFGRLSRTSKTAPPGAVFALRLFAAVLMICDRG